MRHLICIAYCRRDAYIACCRDACIVYCRGDACSMYRRGDACSVYRRSLILIRFDVYAYIHFLPMQENEIYFKDGNQMQNN